MSPDSSSVRLSRIITVGRYRALERNRDRSQIADFIKARFAERYPAPLESIPKEHKSGFCVMAVCCLMIEALESFRQGWEDSRRRNREAFRLFFQRHESMKPFAERADSFYEEVRCGLLHQAESRRGWRILRQGPLMDPKRRTINATRFLREVRTCLDSYCRELEEADWHDEVWCALRHKMDAVCRNCRP